ncbi:MAG TPA: hypothetical protein DCE23_05390, partial [Firmicutes bacterium]|nr:hypothetical protein [Bacillota bacterium]
MYRSNINLNLYKSFYEVAKCGSITEAAKKNFTSQPALSKSLKKLEDELGTSLFYRNLNGVVLTEKGQELYNYVETAFNNLVTGERAMLEDDNLLKGKLSIGVPSQIGTFFLFKKILEFHKEYPNIEITIISKGTKDLITLLENHEIDIMIDTSPVTYTSLNITSKKIHEVNNVFVCTKEFYKKYSLLITNPKDLSNYPLILPIPGTANRLELDNYFLKNKIEVNNLINIHTSEMIISAIKEGLGIGYVIYDLVEEEINNGNFVLLDLKDLPKINIELLYIKNYLTESPIRFLKNYIDQN